MDFCDVGPAIFAPSVLQDALDTLTAVAGDLNAAKVALYTSDTNPSAGLVLADYTLATFIGSTPQAVTWAAAFIKANGNVAALGGLHTFLPTGVISETVYGYVITDTGGTTLLFARRFVTQQQAIPSREPVLVVVEAEIVQAAPSVSLV